MSPRGTVGVGEHTSGSSEFNSGPLEHISPGLPSLFHHSHHREDFVSHGFTVKTIVPRFARAPIPGTVESRDRAGTADVIVSRRDSPTRGVITRTVDPRVCGAARGERSETGTCRKHGNPQSAVLQFNSAYIRAGRPSALRSPASVDAAAAEFLF